MSSFAPTVREESSCIKMDKKFAFGNSIKILEFNDDSKSFIFRDNLNSIFNHDDVKNRKIVAFSIIGAHRSGKSFFLDYCLRFLYANFKSINYPKNPLDNSSYWMGEENEPLQGFSWCSGSNRDTTGINMWSDVFLHTMPLTGEKIAIVLMDTQGLFDNETTPAGNARLFSLGTLISSIQIFNLMNVIQEDQLQYLQLAVDYAKFTALNQLEEDEKPFQKLMFLIRDWHYTDEHKYGSKGGAEYLKRILSISYKQKEEIQSVRRFIKSSFEDLSFPCTLLPYPGNRVAGGCKENVPYNGNWGDMDEDFKDELKSLIEKLLNPSSLVIKKINGKELTGADFKNNIEQYFKLFQSKNLPPVLSIYESTVNKQISLIIGECFDRYKETIFKNQGLITTEDQIPIFHESSRNQALLLYKEKKKMGNAEHEKFYKNVLEAQMNKIFQEWSKEFKANRAKSEEEKAKTQQVIEERNRLSGEQRQSERAANDKLVEIERLNSAFVTEQEKLENERKFAGMNLVTERERLSREFMECEKISANKIIELEKKNAQLLLEQERLQNEVKLADLKLEAEREKFALHQLEIERENDKKNAKVEKKIAENQREQERNKNERELVEARSVVQKERTARLEAQRQAEEANQRQMVALQPPKSKGSSFLSYCKGGFR